MAGSTVDSNLLVYAHNEAAREHTAAKAFLENVVLTGSEQFVIFHQTLFELFSVLSSAAVFERPLSPAAAWNICTFYLSHPALETAAYDGGVVSIIGNLLHEAPQRGKRFFDLMFASTLKYHGIRRLYTRNVKDFRAYTFLEVINPL